MSYLLETSTALVAQAGIWSPLLIVAAFVVSALVFVPRPLLCLLCGFAYGWWGLPLALGSAALGASVAFLVGRHLLRPRVAHRLTASPVARAAVHAVEEEGFRAVVLLRLGPIVPASVQSYLFALTSMPFRPYLLGTLVGTLPGITAQVWTGAVGRAAIEAELGPVSLVLWSCGLVALIVVTLCIGSRVRRLLAAAPA